MQGISRRYKLSIMDLILKVMSFHLPFCFWYALVFLFVFVFNFFMIARRDVLGSRNCCK